MAGVVGSYARIVNYEFNIRRNQLALDRRQVCTNDPSFWELIPKIDSPMAGACGYVKDFARRVFVIKGGKATSAVQEDFESLMLSIQPFDLDQVIGIVVGCKVSFYWG